MPCGLPCLKIGEDRVQASAPPSPAAARRDHSFACVKPVESGFSDSAAAFKPAGEAAHVAIAGETTPIALEGGDNLAGFAHH